MTDQNNQITHPVEASLSEPSLSISEPASPISEPGSPSSPMVPTSPSSKPRPPYQPKRRYSDTEWHRRRKAMAAEEDHSVEFPIRSRSVVLAIQRHGMMNSLYIIDRWLNEGRALGKQYVRDLALDELYDIQINQAMFFDLKIRLAVHRLEELLEDEAMMKKWTRADVEDDIKWLKGWRERVPAEKMIRWCSDMAGSIGRLEREKLKSDD